MAALSMPVMISDQLSMKQQPTQSTQDSIPGPRLLSHQMDNMYQLL